MNIAVAGTGYVGMSIDTLLAQHNHVTAVDVIPEKVEKINNRISPIQDVAMAAIVCLRTPNSCWPTMPMCPKT